MSKKIFCAVGCKYAFVIKEECPTPRLCCHFCGKECTRGSCSLNWEKCESRLSKREAVAYLLTEGLKGAR